MINRNALYLVIGALFVATVVFGYQVYQDSHNKTGVEITVGGQGISIVKK